ncbi:hypothetical protein [Coleofasciculus sp. FACHB-1120]|uniref:hypothetical protein n=1 Tax=Coleofasciculus sp. FACHB-1120 TaxID=2692783 RepID=UPI0016874BF5|nr:hypothetical protein [Coleofasciculus sp. FACHB-1120]MBD2743559.1 hypothetical protein [Coleofasciculus sp. FACHB-1120]
MRNDKQLTNRLIQVESEAPLITSLTAIDEALKLIEPDEHILAIGFKFMHTGESIPLILTDALNKFQYNIYGVDILPNRFQNAITKLNLNIKKCDVDLESLPSPDIFLMQFYLMKFLSI